MLFFRRYFTVSLSVVLLLVLHLGVLQGVDANAMEGRVSTAGPLTVHPTNPRYFADASGRAILLSGSHTWANFQSVEGLPLNYREYLTFLKSYNFNFFRLWTWEQAEWLCSAKGNMTFSPLPYVRTGPGIAIDGKIKFDLDKFYQPYFDRLRARVMAARDQGIYVSVMLFNGFSIKMKGEHHEGRNPWDGHPFNIANNINGIDGDPRGVGDGRDIHTLRIPTITAYQVRYVKKVIDTLNDLDNVLWEISNESEADSTRWQYHMIDLIHSYEASKKCRHPVWMTAQYPGGENATLFGSPAEAVSPNENGGYKDSPPVPNHHKVVISDTDHLWGIGGDYRWVWKSFLRGLNPVFMDPYNRIGDLSEKERRLIRANMGYALAYSRAVNLSTMAPAPGIASSGYCLANGGREYLVYVPGGSVVVDLSSAGRIYEAEWLDLRTGSVRGVPDIHGGDRVVAMNPFQNADAVLSLRSR
jgi:hypothetical protein